MMILEKMQRKMKASIDLLGEAQDFVEQKLEAAGCPGRARMQISVAVEEIFANIAQYAYAPGTGELVIALEFSDSPPGVTIRFTDRGVPYDPLAARDPDLQLPAEDRPIGGLGVFMTKKLMDEVSYEYRDGQNVLTMKKRF